MLRRQVELLLVALKVLTTLPVPAFGAAAPGWTLRAMPWFPLVGQVVGAACALVLMAAAWAWNGWIAALLALAAGLLLTGALHEDGLARTAEALSGAGRDAPVGARGMLALAVVLALKAATLANLPALAAAAALLAAHSLGRAACVVAARLTPYAGAGEEGEAPERLTTAEAAFAVALSLWPLAFLPPTAALTGTALGAVLAAALALAARCRIGGHTGEVLGAVEQVFEVGFLLGVAAVPIL